MAKEDLPFRLRGITQAELFDDINNAYIDVKDILSDPESAVDYLSDVGDMPETNENQEIFRESEDSDEDIPLSRLRGILRY